MRRLTLSGDRLNFRKIRGRNSVVECQLPKLDVAGSSPVARSLELLPRRGVAPGGEFVSSRPVVWECSQ
jgi:hypothetical protein